MHPIITDAHLDKAISYEQYRKLAEDLLKEGKTTGPIQTEALVHYTGLNVHRMNRLDKTVVLKDSLVVRLKALSIPMTWVVLTEAWCGDAAQNLPAIAKMAQVSPDITLKLLLRDENLEVMDQYLTNGSRSVPRLICLHTRTHQELGNWGPRPLVAQQLVQDYKDNPQGMSKEDIITAVHAWYAQDKTLSLQNEFEHLLDEWVAKAQS